MVMMIPRARNPRSFTGGIGPKQQAPPPTLPLSIMPLPTSSPTPTSSSTPTPTPTSSSSTTPLKSLTWAFSPISNATTCTNLTLNWSFFNTTQQLTTLFASPSLQNGVQLDITISGLGSSNVTVPLRFDGTAEGVLGGGSGVEWLVDVEPGLYDVMAIASANGPQSSSSAGGDDEDVSPPIETAFRIHQGDDTSCLLSNPAPSQSSSSSSSSSFSTSTSHSNAGAIAGGVIGGLIALALLGGLLILYRRRRAQSFHQHQSRPPPTQGWNGLNSVGSINVVEKNSYPFSGASGGGGGTDPFSHLVKEPGSPPGSPASVELAHLPFRPRSQTRNSNPDPFATPSPGTPRGGSDVGHDAELSDEHAVDALSNESAQSTPNMNAGRYLAPPYSSNSKHHHQPSLSSNYTTSATTRRASHHSTSRKPVPAYDDLGLTSEEREALGEQTHQARVTPHLPSYKAKGEAADEDGDGDGMSHKSLPSYKSSPGVFPRPDEKEEKEQQGGGTRTGTPDDKSDESNHHHAHALTLLQNLKSKSSGHMKSEGMVHYLIPDPPLEG